MHTEYPEKYVTLGLKIAYYRKKAGYTQEVFAEALDVGVEHYRKIELGYVWITTREYVDFI